MLLLSRKIDYTLRYEERAVYTSLAQL